MGNQILQWSMFILPWLTLFFMKKEDIKRYMPVALFATVMSIIIHDVGVTLRFWTLGASVFPLNQLFPHDFGLMPVLTLWIFKLTYGRFWLYAVTNLILDIGFNFFFLNIFLRNNGIVDLLISPLQELPITLLLAVLIYFYQMWQEGIFTRAAAQAISSPNLQPAAAKPLDKDENKN